MQYSEHYIPIIMSFNICQNKHGHIYIYLDTKTITQYYVDAERQSHNTNDDNQ